jgi:hypothetical protein
MASDSPRAVAVGKLLSLAGMAQPGKIRRVRQPVPAASLVQAGCFSEIVAWLRSSQWLG